MLGAIDRDHSRKDFWHAPCVSAHANRDSIGAKHSQAQISPSLSAHQDLLTFALLFLKYMPILMTRRI